MDVAVKTSDDEAFAKLIATMLVEQVKPVLRDLVRQEVSAALPHHGMTRQEVRKVIKVADDRLAEATIRQLPSYPAGTQRRYWSGAVDKYLTENSVN
ncbi:hypothetical protein [Lacticaseibacillus parakribbianus]|uniref:hypothetical protein n=1 Tax=Lacticaseibacillus parakribbianus TaxID=2970927 RepID=UPI0021CB2B78|nr:hypothetical protein [Lacticaseibacillus parakribbianus]